MKSLNKASAIGLAIGLFVVAGIAFYAAGSEELKPFEIFESAEGRFSVSMPGEPVKVSQTVKSVIGDLDFTMFAADSEKFGFVVGYSDYPEEVFIDSEPMEMLGRVVEGVVVNVKGKLVDEVMLDNYGGAATEYQVDVPDKGVLTSRLILADRRLYQLIAMMPADGYDKTKAAEFFDSFVIDKE